MALKDAIAEVVEGAKNLLTADDRHEDEQTIDEKSEAHHDAIELLKEDHRRVEALFKEILAEKSLVLTSQRSNIAKVIAELTLHAKIEETIVYPAVYGKTKRDTDERLNVLEAYEEHGSMKELMKKIQKAPARDESLKAKVQVLSEITEHHVKEEESEFFPEARKLLGEKRLKEIGLEIAKVKARAARRDAPKIKRASPKKSASRATVARKKRA